MERSTERHGRRLLRSRKVQIVLLGLASVAAVARPVYRASQDLIQRTSAKVSGMMLLETISWEEVGSTNLSSRVTKKLLQDASGLKFNTEILSIDLAQVEKRLLTIPWLESVQVQKKLPSTIDIRYTVHHARALGLRGNRLWSISAAGKWIAPIGTEAFDLPVLVSDETIALEMTWLDTLEQELSPHLLSIHEVNASHLGKVSALIELKYPSQTVRLSILATGKPQADSLTRLKRVVQYLMKNNILVSTIDLRPGKKVVVNVGKHP